MQHISLPLLRVLRALSFVFFVSISLLLER